MRMREIASSARVVVPEVRVNNQTMALMCAVQNCSNGAYWLNKWRKELCETCGCLHKDMSCRCAPPFRLFTFPTVKKNVDRREKWKLLIGRKQGNQLWSPPKDCRVCSRHFIDGEPTVQNPLPTLHIGYNEASKRVKRMAKFDATKHMPTQKRLKFVMDDPTEPEFTATPIFEDPPMPNLTKTPMPFPPILILLSFTLGLFNLVRSQYQIIQEQKEEIKKLKHNNKNLRHQRYSEIILCDKDVNFYTGLSTRAIFDKLHSCISPYVNRRWTGVTSILKNVRKFKGGSRYGPDSEFLLMLIKIRLGLLNGDLAKRFNISQCLVSRIFLAWLRASSSALKSLVQLPDEETLIATKPERFRKLPSLHSIIDCTEIFIETPKDLLLQSSTWSDYKHHNTLKLLVACAPNSGIIFISKAYLGRISDKALTLDSGYLNHIPMHSMVMADKGFTIKEECASRNLSLYVPPGRRGTSQMPSDCVRKTKKIANHRILIEQVIRRLKTFRILSNELAISSVPHIDDILVVCSALSNLKMPIYKT